MPVRVLVSRRIHRSLEPPLDHLALRRRVARASSDLLGGGRRGQVSLLLCSDRVIAGINRDWLEREGPTNVIAFPSPVLQAHTGRIGPLVPSAGVLDACVPAGDPPVHLGDIAVSVDTARREAGASGRDERVVYLALHGLLHVLGWDHEDDASWRRMHRATLRLMSR
jgi:probable rRNA maturation factor